MRKRTEMASAMLTLTVIIALAFGACSRRSQTSVSSGETPDVLRLTIERPIFTSSPKGTLVEETWLKKAAEYAGVSLDLQINDVTYGDYNERLPVYLASGDWADVFYVSGTKDVFDLGTQGLLLNLRNFPEQTKNFFAMAPEDYLPAIVAPDNGVYGFAGMQFSTNEGTQMTQQVKIDVFQRHNLKPPETLDELYQIARQLKSLYPNSFPITGDSYNVHAAIQLAYGISGTQIYYNGTRFEYGYRQPEFRQVLEYLHRLYNERLLDPEYFTMDQLTREGKRVNNQSFYAFDWAEYGPVNHQNMFAYVPKLSVSGGVAWSPVDNINGVQIEGNGAYNIVINAKTRYPELAMKLVDYQYSSEALELFNWGVEGVTYTRRTDGSRQFSDDIMASVPKSIKMAEYGINTSYSVRSGIQFVSQDRDVIVETGVETPVWLNSGFDTITTSWKYYDRLIKDGKAKQYFRTPAVSFTPEETDANNTILTAVNTYCSENMMLFITGERPLSQWDQYLAEMKNYGDIDQVLRNYNSKL
jgi:putative aldouronate transport system substrate-binding protein